MSDQPQPPRLQDTTERSALPLPLPGAEGPTFGASADQPTFAAPVEEPSLVTTGADATAFAAASADDPDEPEASTEESDAVPEVEPDTPETAAQPDDGQPELDPLFAPPAAETFGGAEVAEGGPPPEVLVGAAFLGGVALAFLLKRLGSS